MGKRTFIVIILVVLLVSLALFLTSSNSAWIGFGDGVDGLLFVFLGIPIALGIIIGLISTRKSK